MQCALAESGKMILLFKNYLLLYIVLSCRGTLKYFQEVVRHLKNHSIIWHISICMWLFINNNLIRSFLWPSVTPDCSLFMPCVHLGRPLTRATSMNPIVTQTTFTKRKTLPVSAGGNVTYNCGVNDLMDNSSTKRCCWVWPQAVTWTINHRHQTHPVSL